MSEDEIEELLGELDPPMLELLYLLFRYIEPLLDKEEP